MTPKEEAIRLVELFNDIPDCEDHFNANEDGRICSHVAKACALIHIEEVLKSFRDNVWYIDIETTNVQYYQSIKKEIIKL